MAWRLKLHEERPERPEIGDCWLAPWLVAVETGPCTGMLSDACLAQRAAGAMVRPPIVVRLPGGMDFCVDGPCYGDGARLPASGWLVTGEPPDLTLEPSIDIRGTYHGWIKAGVITDDCEGRRFP